MPCTASYLFSKSARHFGADELSCHCLISQNNTLIHQRGVEDTAQLQVSVERSHLQDLVQYFTTNSHRQLLSRTSGMKKLGYQPGNQPGHTFAPKSITGHWSHTLVPQMHILVPQSPPQVIGSSTRCPKARWSWSVETFRSSFFHLEPQGCFLQRGIAGLEAIPSDPWCVRVGYGMLGEDFPPGPKAEIQHLHQAQLIDGIHCMEMSRWPVAWLALKIDLINSQKKISLLVATLPFW